ncbi:3-hydroxybutyryl-CoA dehydratase [Rubrobacter marinus]|uniref:enoyl-CoA hydratase n=1 Tax=Rubrobacter marinus TaxID=2653852 RepID=A0A6G8PTZ1_9ACTN|nr:enoyl-CoA hydratase-related protein [Rubrobacter marinus]QIN77793.1 3-hydroxybutyryl-CoA dehydratase [Rubrobacter marinus]
MKARDWEQIGVSSEGGVATVTLNRPERYNALGVRIVGEVREALEEIEGSGEVRAMILTGAGDKAFCSGADLKERAGMDDDERWAHNRSMVALAEGLARLQAPTIAALNGLAFGGGLEIALACDFRIAARGARFALPEVGLGIVPGAGGTQRLPRLVGPTHAKELILTGRRIDAERALEMGLVGEVVPAEGLMEAARSLAGEIAANSPLALAYAKAAVDLASETAIEQGLRYETAAIRATLASEDYRIGLAAFAEKKQPEFPPLSARRVT